MVSAIDVARRAKHLVHERLRHRRIARDRAAWRAWSESHQPDWSPENFPHSFINRDPDTVDEAWVAGLVPRRIFVCWTGTNPMSSHRLKGLQAISEVTRVPVELVNPDTLDQWIVPGRPLHPAYEHLSLVHRSDYLRAYLMHHHGGAYSDLKPARHGWTEAFEALDSQPRAMLLGYGEVDGLAVASAPEPLGSALRRHHTHLPGMCAFIARPGTPLTKLWLDEVHRTLDHHLPELIAHPGQIWGTIPSTPLSGSRSWGASSIPSPSDSTSTSSSTSASSRN